MKYKIVGDSSCDVTSEMESQYNIEIAPLSFTLDGEEFIDDETLDLQGYLDKIAKSKHVPKSACPSIQDYLDCFEGDHDYVFVVTLSSELSGSYNSALNAKAMFEEKNPGKQVHVFDSKAASSMEVIMALKIGELAEEGKDFDTIVKEVEDFRKNADLLFVLDKIDTLEKNGRLSLMKAKIVRVLNLKLILKATPQGTIDMHSKARGTNKALTKMVEEMKKLGHISKERIVAISHCNAPDRADMVKTMIEELYDFKDVIVVAMRGLSSTYANEGGIIVAW